jgi:tight adherence protein B
VAGFLLVGGGSAAAGLACLPGGPLDLFWRKHLTRTRASLRALLSRAPVATVAAIPLGASVLGLLGWAALDVRLLGLAVAGWVGPPIWFRVAQRRRVKDIEEQLPGWLSLLANLMRVTGSLLDAIGQTAVMIRGPLGQEIDLLLKEARVGAPLPETLRHMARRIGSSLFHTAATVMLVGRETGGDLPHLLEETSAAFRERLRLEGVIRKQTAAGRTQLVILILSPPVLAYLLYTFDPKFYDPLMALGFLGQLLIAVAIALWILSIVIAKRILNVDI